MSSSSPPAPHHSPVLALPLSSSPPHHRFPLVVSMSSSFSHPHRSRVLGGVRVILPSPPLVGVVPLLVVFPILILFSWSCPLAPHLHPASSCSRQCLGVLWWWWWWWLSSSLSSCRLGILVLIAPAVHPASSGLQQWGWVLGAGLPSSSWPFSLPSSFHLYQKKLLVKRKRN